MKISVQWHRFSVTAICLHLNDTWLEDEYFCRNMSPHITWRLDAMLIYCEDTKFSNYLCFFYFVFPLTSSYMLPRLFRFYLMHFIFCIFFLSISVLVFMPQIMLQGFYSAILWQCLIQSFWYHLFSFAIILFSVLFLEYSHVLIGSKNMYLWTLKTLNNING